MGKPVLRYAVYGIMPRLGVVRVKRAATHREAWNYIYNHGGRLRNKYGMILYVGMIRGED